MLSSSGDRRDVDAVVGDAAAVVGHDQRVVAHLDADAVAVRERLGDAAARECVAHRRRGRRRPLRPGASSAAPAATQSRTAANCSSVRGRGLADAEGRARVREPAVVRCSRSRRRARRPLDRDRAAGGEAESARADGEVVEVGARAGDAQPELARELARGDARARDSPSTDIAASSAISRGAGQLLDLGLGLDRADQPQEVRGVAQLGARKPRAQAVELGRRSRPRSRRRAAPRPGRARAAHRPAHRRRPRARPPR